MCYRRDATFLCFRVSLKSLQQSIRRVAGVNSFLQPSRQVQHGGNYRLTLSELGMKLSAMLWQSEVSLPPAAPA